MQRFLLQHVVQQLKEGKKNDLLLIDSQDCVHVNAGQYLTNMNKHAPIHAENLSEGPEPRGRIPLWSPTKTWRGVYK